MNKELGGETLNAESKRTRSQDDFIAKIGICEQEADE